MSIVRYVHSVVQNTPIMIGTSAPEQTGNLISTYEVREYADLRQTFDAASPTVPVKGMRGYIVTLKQRISVFNSSANSFSALNPITSYTGYPVLLVQQIKPATTVPGLQFNVEDYHPKTLNAAVSTSANQSTTADNANSVQHSSGSSTSVTNSYEISDSVGFFGGDMTGSVSASVGQSTTDTTEQSTSRGSTNSRGAQAGSASSMTVKDWASYAFLDSARQNLSWVWGQEYPWNVIDFRSIQTDAPTQVELPNYVTQRLYDGKTVYPPSELAQFGLDFVGSARWIFYLDGPAAPTDEIVTFAHALTYWEGSHSVSGDKKLQATIQQILVDQQIETVSLNLPLLALDPIPSPGPRNGAVLGFVGNEFIAPPVKDGAPFRARSGANTLYATGQGFNAPTGDDTVLSAPAVTAAAPASLTLYFKVTDDMLELSLHIKHWKLSAAGCVLTLAINEADPAHPVAPIVRHVDALESGSGADNLTTITLRDKDYTSNDFYDYLVAGMNTVVVTVAPADGQTTCGYALRAVAVS